MPAEPADRPVLDPDAIAGHGFNKARKGYEVDEVRAFLVALGSRVRESQQHFADMERRVAELERRAVDPKDLDEDAVTELLGEETARVLDTARKASIEIRTKAAEKAVASTGAADAEATETRQSADQYADGTRTAADEQAVKVRGEADGYAAEVRATADTEVGDLRASANVEIDRTRSEADSVLADRTAEAEVGAGSIRADADAYDGRVRDDADRYADATRAAADSYRADAQGAGDAYRGAATAEGDRLRTEALADAEAIRKDADADAVARREATDAEMESILADAREQGRAMVQEARTYRERVIADLADRRRAARAQLEQLASTRDALAVTLTDVASRIESSHRSLQDAVIDPREMGDLVQDRRMLEASDQPGTSVGVGELEGPAHPVVVDGDEPAHEDGDADGKPAPADDGGQVVAEDAGTGDATDATDELAPEPSVDDIFARLRAEQDEATPEEEAGADLEAGQIAEEAAEVVELDGSGADGSEVDGSEATVDQTDPDPDLLDRRDATTDELERQLARRLKRVLSDEQNEVLDLLRRTRGTPGAAEVLPTEALHLERYTSAALEDLVAAERAGAAFFGSAPRSTADVRDVATEFASEMVRQIRGRLERAFDDGGDENEVGERIRACYREWKTQRIAAAARHYVVVAFSRGVAEAAADGTAFRWLVDDGDSPCPDCDDNALAGPNPKGEPFPTGDLCPPAHPGCRCLAVPVDAG